MCFFLVLRIALFLLMLLIILTQVIWPMCSGTQFFWFFRKDYKKVFNAEDELTKTKLLKNVKDINQEINALKEELKEKETEDEKKDVEAKDVEEK